MIGQLVLQTITMAEYQVSRGAGIDEFTGQGHRLLDDDFQPIIQSESQILDYST